MCQAWQTLALKNTAKIKYINYEEHLENSDALQFTMVRAENIISMDFIPK
jgi:hypothetical protein